MQDDIVKKFKDQVQKAHEALAQKLGKVRTGRAHIGILDGVKVDYYGTPSPLNQVANLSVPDPRTITLKPFDRSQVQAIEKAIRAADLGLNPLTQGDIIRVPIPALNEERRKELVKQVKKFGEEIKVEIRNFRRDSNEEIKTAEKGGKLTEDESKKAQTTVQKETDAAIAAVDGIIAKKEKDLMEI
ncbi:MAG: ribosome recycling factor [Deltaproteobacteria bacterium]|nr:ribosome recycling factor [Deltaproteobacteria bacterium]